MRSLARVLALTLLLAIPTQAQTASLAQPSTDSIKLLAMPFPTPVVYYAWWHDVESCLGVQRNIDEIKWQEANRSIFSVTLRKMGDSLATLQVNGVYMDADSTIVVGFGWETVAGLVRHEIAHALFRHRYNEHPDSVFNGKCASLFLHQNSSDVVQK